MDPSFKDRVDKVFGSISSSSSIPWSLTGAHVEKREWNRHKGDIRDDETLASSSFHNCFSFQRKGTDDDDENDGDEWDMIRSSIGLDCTLDNEEEEDAYDKMAQGRENGCDNLCMKDVTDHGPYLNSQNILSSSVDDFKKDPRVDHDAAKTRLKEDEDMLINATEVPCEDGIRIKSILKRKSDIVGKPAKRVRFDPTCKNDDGLTNAIQLGQQRLVCENGCNVPDYILNPSKYIRYSFDDVNDKYNSKSYEDFHKQVKQLNHVELELKSGSDLPRSVPFIPKKKGGEVKATCNTEGQIKQSSFPGISFDIAVLEGEIEMQEDDAVCTFQKPDRRYRSKMEKDEDVY